MRTQTGVRGRQGMCRGWSWRESRALGDVGRCRRNWKTGSGAGAAEGGSLKETVSRVSKDGLKKEGSSEWKEETPTSVSVHYLK